MQEYIIRDTGEVLNGSQLLQKFSHISFSFEEEQLNDIGVDIVYVSEQPTLTDHEKSEYLGVLLENGKYFHKYIATELTAEEIADKLAQEKAKSLSKINTDDNKIYADVIGNKATEYTSAEVAATAWKASGYQGAAPEEVQSWADAKGWTARQANDDILYQAQAWRGAAALIRRTRLKAKEDVKRATTLAEIAVAMTIWNGFVTSIRVQLGV